MPLVVRNKARAVPSGDFHAVFSETKRSTTGTLQQSRQYDKFELVNKSEICSVTSGAAVLAGITTFNWKD